MTMLIVDDVDDGDDILQVSSQTGASEDPKSATGVQALRLP